MNNRLRLWSLGLSQSFCRPINMFDLILKIDLRQTRIPDQEQQTSFGTPLSCNQKITNLDMLSRQHGENIQFYYFFLRHKGCLISEHLSSITSKNPRKYCLFNKLQCCLSGLFDQFFCLAKILIKCTEIKLPLHMYCHSVRTSHHFFFRLILNLTGHLTRGTRQKYSKTQKRL